MKKWLRLILLLSLLFGCSAKPHVDPVEDNEMGRRFKVEYEALNEQKAEDGTPYLAVKVNEENPMVYADYQQIKTLLTSGTGVIYFGFPECPWCRNVVPVLIEALSHQSIKTVYYFNNKDSRDQKKIDTKGDVITEKEATKEYQELLSLLGDFASDYQGLKDPRIKRLYFPTVIMVKEGEIVFFHESSLDSQTDPYIAMDESQQAELKELYSQGFNALQAGCAVEKAC